MTTEATTNMKMQRIKTNPKQRKDEEISRSRRSRAEAEAEEGKYKNNSNRDNLRKQTKKQI
jgi:hypothetical protein